MHNILKPMSGTQEVCTFCIIKPMPGVQPAYKYVHFPPTETVHPIWFPLRLYAISCFPLRLMSTKNGFLLNLFMLFCFLLTVSAGGRPIMQKDSAGSHLSCTAVSAGSKRLGTVVAKAKYNGQSGQEAKNWWTVYTCEALISDTNGDNQCRNK